MRARGDAVLPPVARLSFAYATPKVRLRYKIGFSALLNQLSKRTAKTQKEHQRRGKGGLKEDDTWIKVR